MTVSQRAPGAAAEAEDFVLHYAEAQLAEPTTVTLRLKGRGCTDPAAANYTPFATEDDGSCARAHLMRLEVKARGRKGFYAIDGEEYERLQKMFSNNFNGAVETLADYRKNIMAILPPDKYDDTALS